MPDVMILGCGPAGISAALYTARAGLDTLVVGERSGALLKTDKIQNYYGFPEPVSGGTLFENGIAQAQRVGARFVWGEILGVSYDGSFTAATSAGEVSAPLAVLATGAARKAPKIPGAAEFEGRGVSYCAVCDAFFYRKKKVAVLGSGDYALHEARELLPVVEKVTVLTDGERPAVRFPSEMGVDTRKIGSLFGGETLTGVKFADGSSLEAAGLFVALGVAGSTDLARKLGAEIRNGAVVTDEDRRTNVPGLYAAGDCTGGLLQIAKAVYDGAAAGTSAVKEFRRMRAEAKG